MAHNLGAMDIDDIEGDHDKENACYDSNMLRRASYTEKGYEELDVSELNMKLRYSFTPSSSPMSKSYTASCVDNKHESQNDSLNNVIVNENSNLTRSMNSAMIKSDTAIKSPKSLPLQVLPQEQFSDGSDSVLKLLDTTTTVSHNNVIITLSGANDPYENLSIQSSSSTNTHTPEATTPTTEISKQEVGSPIIRGLKSVLNMFRPSQSPISQLEENKPANQAALSPPIVSSPTRNNSDESSVQAVLASTPIAAYKKRESSSKRNSPHKDSIVFNDDLERELQWKDETTIIFSQERIPVHKLFFQNKFPVSSTTVNDTENNKKLNCTVEYMDISYNESLMKGNMYTESSKATDNVLESDSEFVDCETTFTKNESQMDNNENMTLVNTDEQNLNTVNINNKLIATSANLILDNNVPEKVDTTFEHLVSTTSIKTSDLTIDVSDDLKENVDSIPVLKNPNELNTDTVPEVIPESSKTNVPSQEKTKVENLDASPQSQLKLNITAENSNDSYLTNINKCLNINLEVGYRTVIEETEPVKSNFELEFNNKNVAENIKITSTVNEDVSDVEQFLDNEIINQPADVPLPNEDDVEKEASSSNDYIKDFVDPDVGQNLDDNIQINTETKEIQACNLTSDTIIDNKMDKLHEDQVEEMEAVKPSNGLLQIDIDKENQSNVLMPNEVCNVENVEISLKVEETDSMLTKKIDFEPMEINMTIEEILHDTAEIKQPTNFDNIKQHAENNHVSASCDVVIINNVNSQENTETENISLLVQNNNTLTEGLNLPHNDLKIYTNSLEEDISTTEMNSQCYLKLKRSENVEGPISSDENVISQNLPPLPNLVATVSEDLTSANEPIEENKPEVIQEEYDSNSTAFNHEIILREKSIAIINKSWKYDNKMEYQNCLMPDKFQQNESATKNGNEIVEEVTVCESNSAYVSVIAELELASENKVTDPFEKIENPFSTKTEIINSPPGSPKIMARGNYNFNFDEIHDPFATKTEIRMSPPPLDASPNDFLQPANKNTIKTTEQSKKGVNKNRRISQPERNKKSVIHRKNFNKTFDSISNVSKDISNIQLEPPVGNISHKADNYFQEQPNDKLPGELTHTENTKVTEVKSEFTETSIGNMNTNEKHQALFHEDDTDKPKFETNVDNTRNAVNKKNNPLDDIPSDETMAPIESILALTEQKNTSSLEQSVYYSAGTSSSEGIQSKSVFNLPEIDDTKFNPFVTKSKIRQSPPPSLDSDNSFNTRSEIKSSLDASIIVSQTKENQKDNDVMFSNTELNQIDVTTNSSSLRILKTPIENDMSHNISNLTCSSKTTDEKEITVREVNTEDEDTIEGPFLEAEDFNNVDKMSDFDVEKVDMMQFNDFPAQGSEENAETGELFIDAEAFNFLMNQNKSTEVVESGKESLFLKFDPLFAKRVNSDGVVAALSKIQKRQSTPKKLSGTPQQNMTLEKAPIGDFLAPNVNHLSNVDNALQENNEDLNVTVSKPMMVVTPAVNPLATTKNKITTPTRSSRFPISFTSPAIAVIDRLLSLSANNSPVSHDTTSNMNREQAETDQVLAEFRELSAAKKIELNKLRTQSRQMRERLMTLESHMKQLETEGSERLKKINELNDTLANKTKINKNKAAIVEEYERTIASLVAEMEHEKKHHAEERMKLIEERDEQRAHLASMELAFIDIHSKYEKNRQAILSHKTTEDTYMQKVKKLEDNFAKIQKNYDLLKHHATSKLNHANQELEKLNRTHKAEILKINAMIRRNELHITSLEETLAQKSKENDNLTAICDDLINRVS